MMARPFGVISTTLDRASDTLLATLTRLWSVRYSSHRKSVVSGTRVQSASLVSEKGWSPSAIYSSSNASHAGSPKIADGRRSPRLRRATLIAYALARKSLSVEQPWPAPLSPVGAVFSKNKERRRSKSAESRAPRMNGSSGDLRESGKGKSPATWPARARLHDKSLLMRTRPQGQCHGEEEC